MSDAGGGKVAVAVDVLGVPEDERPAFRGYPAGIPRPGPIVTYRDWRVMPVEQVFRVGTYRRTSGGQPSHG